MTNLIALLSLKLDKENMTIDNRKIRVLGKGKTAEALKINFKCCII